MIRNTVYSKSIKKKIILQKTEEIINYQINELTDFSGSCVIRRIHKILEDI